MDSINTIAAFFKWIFSGFEGGVYDHREDSISEFFLGLFIWIVIMGITVVILKVTGEI